MGVVSSSRIIVVGGALAGQSAVTEVIEQGFDGEIVWITGETVLPYSKPALSKEFIQGRSSLREIQLPRVSAEFSRLKQIDGCRAVSLEGEARQLVLEGGQVLSFEGLVICSGARARMPEFAQGIGGVFALRHLQDALEIQKLLPQKPRVAILGGGLIGCEMAASLRGLGLQVILVEMQNNLLERPFGPAFGQYFVSLQRDHGVEVILGQGIQKIETQAGKIAAVVLEDGRQIEAELLLIGAGSVPEVEWLASSGLGLENGLLCDANLETTTKGIFAAGDVASWINPYYGRRMRVEHWTNASAQGRAAATNLLRHLSGARDQMRPFADIPYFWSDQYGLKLQMVGWHLGHDRIETEWPEGGVGPLVRYYQGPRLVAAAGVNAARAVMTLRRKIEIAAQESQLEGA